jgi:hypothetical protein
VQKPATSATSTGDSIDLDVGEEPSVQPDLLASLRSAAETIVKTDKRIVPDVCDPSKGVAWGTIKVAIRQMIDRQTGPKIDDADQLAYELVAQAMQAVYGAQDVGWKCEKRPGKNGKMTSYVFVLSPQPPAGRDS